MKIAYLILAHNNYIHLQRLIDALSTPDCRFYIHIDKKAKMPDIRGADILFVKDRVRVYHSSFTEVEATIKLMKLAATNPVNEYFVLLSGVDYPVTSNKEIKKRFGGGGQFMQILKWPNEYHPSSYFKYYYFNSVNRRSNDVLKKVIVGIEKFLRKVRIRKNIPFQIYTGSQWFALSVESINYILNEIKLTKGYKSFFKSCRFPCESFFHTIIGNSLLRDHVSNPFTYVEFTNNGVVLINTEHFEKIKTGNYLLPENLMMRQPG